ncbi:iron-containing alcohol dehydrogenase [Aquabacter cavernae]|uniref:iron-containing alcohol dehydrogenase n=1 Tax=Aquabacter cavernae TaxID=2496029 RepID=UPI0013DE88DB|nr:iron-containing alcohol dehydrogenase [Aquabacter cavernae]
MTIISEDMMDARIAAAPANLRDTKPFVTAGLRAPNCFLVGLGASRRTGAVAGGLTSGRRALLISDHVIAGTGAVGLLERSLSSAGFAVSIFLEVEPEPHLATIEAVEALAAEAGADVVVGIGGGSVMDVAKLAALAIGSGATAGDHLRRPQETPRAGALPLILLPTTSGTGSEVSMYVVATVDGHKRFLMGQELIPHAAILDPLLTLSMPRSVTAATGLDALTHATEALMGRASNALNETVSLGAIATILRALPAACDDGQDLEARYAMAVASSLAMMSFNLSGGLWAHSVSYVLTGHFKTPHGIGCGLALPGLVEFNGAASASLMERLVPVLGDAPGERIRALMARVGVSPRLADHGVQEDRLGALAREMVEQYPRPGNPVPMGLPEAERYWLGMYRGEAA